MSSKKLQKIKQHPKNACFTLHKRLIGLPDPLDGLFDADVATYIDLKVNHEYLASCIITSIAFVASTVSTIESFGATFPINFYSIFIGRPTSERSQAIQFKHCSS